jgi:hypothetical protein
MGLEVMRLCGLNWQELGYNCQQWVFIFFLMVIDLTIIVWGTVSNEIIWDMRQLHTYNYMIFGFVYRGDPQTI